MFSPSTASANLLSRLADYYSLMETLHVVNLIYSLSLKLTFRFIVLLSVPPDPEVFHPAYQALSKSQQQQQ